MGRRLLRLRKIDQCHNICGSLVRDDLVCFFMGHFKGRVTVTTEGEIITLKKVKKIDYENIFYLAEGREVTALINNDVYQIKSAKDYYGLKSKMKNSDVYFLLTSDKSLKYSILNAIKEELENNKTKTLEKMLKKTNSIVAIKDRDNKGLRVMVGKKMAYLYDVDKESFFVKTKSRVRINMWSIYHYSEKINRCLFSIKYGLFVLFELSESDEDEDWSWDPMFKLLTESIKKFLQNKKYSIIVPRIGVVSLEDLLRIDDNGANDLLARAGWDPSWKDIIHIKIGEDELEIGGGDWEFFFSSANKKLVEEFRQVMENYLIENKDNL